MTKVKVMSHLPTRWPGFKGLIAQGNLRITRGHLRAKLLIFETPADMQRYWRKRMGNNLGRGCLGAVNSLRRTVYWCEKGKPDKVVRIEVDSRYYCVIALCRKHLTMRIISHECVHAGYAYAKRRTRAPWHVECLRFDEEMVAYPAGELARAIVIFLERNGFYEKD
jgi:hypothetical protein